VELEQQVEFRCLPPEAFPKPNVTWIRNGVILRGQEQGLRISQDGRVLLVLSARLADAANYSCAAENVAGRRVSEPATLTIYGEWNCFIFLHQPTGLKPLKVELRESRAPTVLCFVSLSPLARGSLRLVFLVFLENHGWYSNRRLHRY